ncbi:hypothetical protein HIM_07236 [Hirsutella minnesotensis 3608]|uniref:Uncharacterized protein n=1 Tax=Hirsutella minnesotensis 3608 TaxID=1043627 RepID=A0A0F7ZZ17_9HYPO|nr:hypothetical protein HIM_07236 [Hirsutella minnesotensis 3608]
MQVLNTAFAILAGLALAQAAPTTHKDMQIAQDSQFAEDMKMNSMVKRHCGVDEYGNPFCVHRPICKLHPDGSQICIL